MRVAMRSNLAVARRPLADRWLIFLCISLLGYALIGRGYAYVGFPPLFVGEICLLIGLFLFLETRGWTQIFRIGAAVAVLPLALWGTIRMVPFLPEYQIDAVRDAVIWGYAAFALVIASLIVADPSRLPKILEYYRRFTKIFLIGIPIAFLVYRFARQAIPMWPWANAPLVQVKEGDVMVHLAGILAFWMADPKRTVSWPWTVLLTVNMAMMGVIDRAGVVSFGAVMAICVAARPKQVAAWRTITMVLVGVFALWASQIKVPVPGGKGRDISFDQFVINFNSMIGKKTNEGLDSTKEWRMDWWNKIIGYTFQGEYFWTGKGFGVNLADEDGFQVQRDKSLRSPHSIHMNFLARLGVPGLAMWAGMNLVWLFTVFDCYLRSRRRGQLRWSGTFLFLLCYLVAFLINGSFDVFIEGPMGGIWFWSIYGTGVGAMWAWRACPQILSDVEEQQQLEEHANSGRAQLLPAAGWRGPGVPVGTSPARGLRPSRPSV